MPGQSLAARSRGCAQAFRQNVICVPPVLRQELLDNGKVVGFQVHLRIRTTLHASHHSGAEDTQAAVLMRPDVERESPQSYQQKHHYATNGEERRSSLDTD